MHDGVDLAGTTILVTGATTGIGRATAEALAGRGARLVLGCRSAGRATEALASVRTAAAAADAGAEPAVLELDLADLASVARAVDDWRTRSEPLHVIVANAGLAGRRGVTAQGFELAFGTNHLGHHALVTGLLPDLREAAAATGRPSRVVVVASESHQQARGIAWDAVQRRTRSITGLREYAVSKLANVAFAQELARRVPSDQVVACSLHPGVIASDIWRSVPWPVRPLLTRRMATVADGARTSIHCATADDVVDHPGGYWIDAAPATPNTAATPALGAELWERSDAWVAADR